MNDSGWNTLCYMGTTCEPHGNHMGTTWEPHGNHVSNKTISPNTYTESHGGIGTDTRTYSHTDYHF